MPVLNAFRRHCFHHSDTDNHRHDLWFIASARTDVPRLLAEVERLRGVIAQHELCHDLHGKVDASAFAAGCAAEQRRIYGCAPDADENASLRAEVEQLREVNRALVDGSIADATLSFFNGGFQVEHWAIRLLCASFKESISDAKNYVETTVSDREGNAFVVTIRRRDGKTPHQCRQEAEAENASLRAEVERLRLLREELNQTAGGG